MSNLTAFRFYRALGWLALTLALVPPAGAEEIKPRLSVVGEGIASATPDMAIVGIGVVAQATRAADALAQNSKAMSEVIAAAKLAGVEPRDLQTRQVSLRPLYSNPAPGSREAAKVVGYEAGNRVAVRVRDLDKLGTLLDRLVTTGVNQFHGLELTVAEPAPLHDAARAEAVRDARRRAELIADAAGVRIVRLLSVAEGVREGPSPLAMPMAREAAARPAVPIEAGEWEFRARVTAVFEIAPKAQ